MGGGELEQAIAVALRSERAGAKPVLPSPFIAAAWLRFGGLSR